MIRKRYKAGSDIAINVVDANGVSHHISFMPLTHNGSIYITTNPKVQAALESHPRFGKLFKLEYAIDEEKEAEELKKKKEAEEKAAVQETNQAVEIDVSCIADAKEYLADRFGIARTSLRSKVSIETAAKQHNIIFKGL